MAQADNVLLLYRDYVAESSLTGSGETTPFERVQELRPSRKWVADDDEAAWIGGDVGEEVAADTFAVISHNFGVAVTLRLRLGTDSQLLGSTPDATGIVYDAEFEAWPPVAGLGFDGFGESLGGYPVLSEFADYLPYTLQQFGESIEFRYWRLDVASSIANPAGDFSIGRIMIGTAFQTEVNISFNWSWEWADPSTITDTESSFLIRRRKKYRIARMAWESLRAGEAFGSMDDFKRIVGKSREVLVVLFPTGDTTQKYRTTIYGVPEESGAIANPFYDVFSTSIAVRELRA